MDLTATTMAAVQNRRYNSPLEAHVIGNPAPTPEGLYLAYIVGLTSLGLRVNATFAVPNQGRLDTIIHLIEQSGFSIHDVSRIETTDGIPRFDMPVELGLALYRSHVASAKHRVFIFESKRYRAQRSTGDVNGIDPQIHVEHQKG